MDERRKFIARLLDGEKMARLCRRVRDLAQDRLQDPRALQRARTRGAHRPLAPAVSPRQPASLPDRDADRAPQAGEAELGRAEDQGAAEAALPGCAHAGDQHGARGARPPRLGQARRGRRNRAKGTALSNPCQPNDLWCADYKGEFMLADRRYCYPLTITDFASRYLLACEALSTTKEEFAFGVFERAFKEFGLPQAIRTDNGVPFASPNALYLSSCRFGGSGSASRLSASSQATRSRMDATSACT